MVFVKEFGLNSVTNTISVIFGNVSGSVYCIFVSFEAEIPFRLISKQSAKSTKSGKSKFFNKYHFGVIRLRQEFGLSRFRGLSGLLRNQPK